MYPNQGSNTNNLPYPQQPTNTIAIPKYGFPGQNPYYQPSQQQQGPIEHSQQLIPGSMPQPMIYPNMQQSTMYPNMQHSEGNANFQYPSNMQPPLMVGSIQQPGFKFMNQTGMQTIQQPEIQSMNQPGIQGIKAIPQPGFQTFQHTGIQSIQQPGFQTVEQLGIQCLQQSGMPTVQQPMSQSMPQPGMPSIQQPMSQSMPQPGMPTVQQAMSQSMPQPGMPSIQQPISQSMPQPGMPSIQQPISQSMHQPGTLNFRQNNSSVPQLMYNQNVQNQSTSSVAAGMQQTVLHPGIQHGIGYQQQTQGTSVQMPRNCPIKKTNPSLKPAEKFNVYKDAEDLLKAMKGLGTDKSSLIKILCRRTCSQRLEIVAAFSHLHNRSLHEDIKSETSGNFQKVLLALLIPIEEFYAREIYESLSSSFTKPDVIIDVLCLMTNYEISNLVATYARIYKKNLVQHIKKNFSGGLGNMLTSLAQEKRVENPQDEKNLPTVDANLLKQAISKTLKDEAIIAEIFGLRSSEHLKLMSIEYAVFKGNSLEIDIAKKFSGNFRDALLLRLNPEKQSNHFARRLHESMAGLGTNDSELIRLCITRSEIDMDDIKPEFKGICGQSLKSFIIGDTSGDYRKALLTLCGEY